MDQAMRLPAHHHTTARRLPACRVCGAHDGRAYGRGWSAGVRLLADALARADLDRARELIELAERKAAERGAR